MSYVLGSDRTRAEFGEVITYHPGGRRHAVDLSTAINAKVSSVGYALCGAAVHVWPSTPFDPDVPDVDDRCRTLAQLGQRVAATRTDDL